MGIVFATEKALRMQGVQCFLGAVTDVSRVQTDAAIILQCKPSTRDKGVQLIDNALSDQVLTPAAQQKRPNLEEWSSGLTLGFW
eukprot:2114354-Amphidinium_carterae.1